MPAQGGEDAAERRADPLVAAARVCREGGGEVREQPRPAEAPAAHDHAVAAGPATMLTASSADQMSPLPSTGTFVTASLSRAIADQSAVPE